MPYANINTPISAADLTLLLSYFTSIEARTTFAVNLTKKENNEVVKLLGKKSSEFLLRVQKIAGNNPNLVPLHVSLTGFRSDITLTNDLLNLVVRSSQITERLTDTHRAVKNEALRTALQLYNIGSTTAESNYPGIDAIVQELKPFFPRTGKRKKGPSETE
ncbi:MAG: hypothetical protein SH856_03640 [Flavobacteriales bacterium]|nr:hypothetical protein [Flavobacteriales bacterium]